MVKEGYRDVGYTYVNSDDCWMAKNRAEDGRLMEDRERFPSGLKALGDYVSHFHCSRLYGYVDLEV